MSPVFFDYVYLFLSFLCCRFVVLSIFRTGFPQSDPRYVFQVFNVMIGRLRCPNLRRRPTAAPGRRAETARRNARKVAQANAQHVASSGFRQKSYFSAQVSGGRLACFGYRFRRTFPCKVGFWVTLGLVLDREARTHAHTHTHTHNTDTEIDANTHNNTHIYRDRCKHTTITDTEIDANTHI